MACATAPRGAKRIGLVLVASVSAVLYALLAFCFLSVAIAAAAVLVISYLWKKLLVSKYTLLYHRNIFQQDSNSEKLLRRSRNPQCDLNSSLVPLQLSHPNHVWLTF